MYKSPDAIFSHLSKFTHSLISEYINILFFFLAAAASAALILSLLVRHLLHFHFLLCTKHFSSLRFLIVYYFWIFPGAFAAIVFNLHPLACELKMRIIVGWLLNGDRSSSFYMASGHVLVCLNFSSSMWCFFCSVFLIVLSLIRHQIIVKRPKSENEKEGRMKCV